LSRPCGNPDKKQKGEIKETNNKQNFVQELYSLLNKMHKFKEKANYYYFKDDMASRAELQHQRICLNTSRAVWSLRTHHRPRPRRLRRARRVVNKQERTNTIQ
uniref:Uncharacterized protein n=1 Tax=Dicentrarchus labrax TaxID=13489 RepID=A0A8C4IN57_DICLA